MSGSRRQSSATVGWLLKDNADAKVVCQSVGDLGDPENAQASGVMTIPARCILNGSNTQGWHTGALSAGGLADLRGEFLAAGSLS